MNTKGIKVKNITKVFGKVIANKNVNFEVKPGEIHCLLGENGAGKSTLMSILSGVYTPDNGSIFVDGKKVNFNSPRDSIKHGIGMVYQHFKLVESMTALQNILLGNNKGIFSRIKEKEREIKEIIDKYGFDVDLNKLVHNMSVGEKENLEILKVVYRGARVLVLDEPTAVFTPQETDRLFSVMRKMKEDGCAIIFITHKLDEVMKVADRITILRKGETVATINKDKANPQILTELMVGRKVNLSIKAIKSKLGKEILKVENLKVKDSEGVEAVKGISFSIKAGEVLGIAGITGSGQKELCEAIAGITPIESGKIIFENKDITNIDSTKYFKENIKLSYIPEDRLGMGLVGDMGIADNLLLKNYKKQKGLFINKKSCKDEANFIIKEFNVKTAGVEYPIKYMSGGNIQKILLGRELNSNPKLIVMAYPVRGLDISTCYAIYDVILKEKQKGSAILFIGEDLDVLMAISDRIMVMYSGEITGITEAEKVTREGIGLMMMGRKDIGEEYVNEVC
ncbi:ABC transporter ATP-binding protein [Clostridium isatidis]|uniref:ABC transporter ATP-binding protein n=1 Tax=Clostridium isatidis TaxID=182773 RepID=A0A343JF59_9CLOT|nr:ABC transporter ATP-binding protein [Clostridium isatidis]ASW44167.1 ABC transporter ATP-binding protein [Clostridium isatidis]NLZ34925.1 ABC transporter ATP-binding protein [Clostridiales bacterium]